MKKKLVYHPGCTKRSIMKKLVCTIFLVSLVAVASLYIGQTRVYREAQAELDALELNLEAISAENESLKEKVFLLQDDDYLEIQARKHLGMVKEGELIFKIVD